jgi:hypothetical protein
LSCFIARQTLKFASETGVESPAGIDPDRPGWTTRVVVVSRFVGCIGIALAAAISWWLDDARWDPLGTPVNFVLITAALWLLFRNTCFTIARARTIDRLSAETELDLVRLRPLCCFGRIGFWIAATWIIGASLYWILETLFPFVAARDDISASVMAAFIAFSFTIALIAFVWPVLGARRRIRQAKEGALDEVEGAILQVRDAAVAGGRDPQALARLADLLAYRSFVEGVREWPFERGTALRCFVTLGVWGLSWGGEELFGRLLGIG